MNSFSKYILSTDYVPGSILGAVNMSVNKTDKSLALIGIIFSSREMISKHNVRMSYKVF